MGEVMKVLLDELKKMSTADVLNTRSVWMDMHVDYGGVKYDLSGMPDVRPGEWVIVCPNPEQAGTVRVMRLPSAGGNAVYVAPQVDVDGASAPTFNLEKSV